MQFSTGWISQVPMRANEQIISLDRFSSGKVLILYWAEELSRKQCVSTCTVILTASPGKMIYFESREHGRTCRCKQSSESSWLRIQNAVTGGRCECIDTYSEETTPAQQNTYTSNVAVSYHQGHNSQGYILSYLEISSKQLSHVLFTCH